MKKTLFLSAILGAALCSSAFAASLTADTSAIGGITYNGGVYTFGATGAISNCTHTADVASVKGTVTQNSTHDWKIFANNQSVTLGYGHTIHLTKSGTYTSNFTPFSFGGLIVDSVTGDIELGRADTFVEINGMHAVNMDIKANTKILGNRQDNVGTGIEVHQGGTWTIADEKTLTLSSDKSVTFDKGAQVALNGAGTLKLDTTTVRAKGNVSHVFSAAPEANGLVTTQLQQTIFTGTGSVNTDSVTTWTLNGAAATYANGVVTGTATANTYYAAEDYTYNAADMTSGDVTATEIYVAAGKKLSASLAGAFLSEHIYLATGAKLNNSNSGAWGTGAGVNHLTLEGDAAIESAGGIKVNNSLNLQGHTLTLSTDVSAGGIYIGSAVSGHGKLLLTKGASQFNTAHTLLQGIVDVEVRTGATMRMQQNFEAASLSGAGTLMASDNDNRMVTMTLNSDLAQTFSGTIKSDGSNRKFTLKNGGVGTLSFRGTIEAYATLEGVVTGTTSNVLYETQYGDNQGTLKNVQVNGLQSKGGANNSITLDGMYGYFADSSTQGNLTLTGNGVTLTNGFGGHTTTLNKLTGTGKIEDRFWKEETFIIKDAETWTGTFSNTSGTLNLTFNGNTNADVTGKATTNVTLQGNNYSGMEIKAYNGTKTTVNIENSTSDVTIYQMIKDPNDKTSDGILNVVIDNADHTTTVTGWTTVSSVTLVNNSSVELGNHRIGTLTVAENSDSSVTRGGTTQVLSNIVVNDGASLTMNAADATVESITLGDDATLTLGSTANNGHDFDLTTTALTVSGEYSQMNANLVVMNRGSMTFENGAVLTMGCDVTIGNEVSVYISGEVADIRNGLNTVTIIDGLTSLDEVHYTEGKQSIFVNGVKQSDFYLTTVESEYGGYKIVVAPEPATATLSLLALAALASRRKRH